MPTKTVADFKIEFVQVMDDEGNVDKKLMPKLSEKQIKDFYEKLVLLRTFDDKSFNMQRQGRIGTYIQFKGQEASQLGTASALTDKDWMFPMYRSGAAMITHGFPMHKLLQYEGGDMDGMHFESEKHIFPMAIPVCSQIPHAAGCAWASKIKGEKVVTMTYVGDGGTSKGDFHEGINFAGVNQAPAVFVVENNQYAISVSRKIQTHAETIAQKGIAYGIKCVQVDGNDIFAVYKVAKEAVDNARAGKGPTLIESVTYRMGDHSTSDDAKKYRSEKEVKEWTKKDPILRLEKYMQKNKLLDDKYKEEVAAKAKEIVEKEVATYEAIPDPQPEVMFKHTYAELTPQLKEQLDELKRSL